MLVSYHVHSGLSDGEGEIADFVRAARDMGLDEVGISDHYVLTPDGRQVNWGMPLDGIDAYVNAVKSAAGEIREGVVVRLGVEADYFPETASALGDILAAQPFDYVIGSVHILDGFSIDANPEVWEPLTQDERDDVIRGYWVRLRQMAESRLFDFAGHLDITKKFGIWPSIDLSGEVSSALDAIAQADMAVELNTSGWYMPCREAYPSASIIRGCCERGIPVLVTADAHRPSDLIRGFERALRLLRDTGYTELASYAGRRRLSYTLP